MLATRGAREDDCLSHEGKAATSSGFGGIRHQSRAHPSLGCTYLTVRSEEGSASIETVASIATLALFAAVMLQLILVIDAYLLAGHATREGARAAALGEGNTGVIYIVSSVAGLDPHEAAVTVTPADRDPGDLVTVSLEAEVAKVPVIAGILPELRVSSSATARTEVEPS
jgi:hypothetical protein